MMKQAVILDMDGLLLDSERPVCDAWLVAAGQRGYPMTESIYLELLGRDDRDGKDILCNHFGSEFPFDEIYTRVGQIVATRVGRNGYGLKDGAIELIQFLVGRSVPCLVATSTTRTTARRRLLDAGILRYICDISGGDEVANGKPEPDLFLLAARKQGLNPRDCLVLEDSAFGARAAHRAGMEVIVIPDMIAAAEDVLGFSLGVFPSIRDCRPAVECWLTGHKWRPGPDSAESLLDAQRKATRRT